MIKKTINYTDFDGKERSEDFYFNLTKRELAELNLRYPNNDGLKGYVEKIVKEQNVRKVYETIKEIVLLSYGIKSDDGKHFNKSKAISNDFVNTMAFDELIMSFFGETEDEAKEGAEELSRFVQGILPANANVGDANS